ncbi:MAG: alpha/beta hydrolase fold domain-containing protein [Pseudomonadota bacterium]
MRSADLPTPFRNGPTRSTASPPRPYGEGAALSGGPTHLTVAGDSAGGNFAAALVVRARDEGMRTLDSAILLSPVTDLVYEDHASFEARAPTGFIYDTAFMGFVRGADAMKKAHWTHPHVSPLRADLSGFSPTLIVTGGVAPVEHHVAEGQDHGFYFFRTLVPEGDVTFAGIQSFLAKVS